MKNQSWTLSKLALVGLAPIASLALLILPAGATTTSTDAKAKLQKFDLSEMTVEDISKIENSNLRNVLSDSYLEKETLIARPRGHSKHSQHSKTIRRNVQQVQQSENPDADVSTENDTLLS